jgi:hypothetical protein
MAEMFLVKQGMVGDNFVHRPGDIVAWEAVSEIPALLEAGILEVYSAPPPETPEPETPESKKSKKKESR